MKLIGYIVNRNTNRQSHSSGPASSGYEIFMKFGVTIGHWVLVMSSIINLKDVHFQLIYEKLILRQKDLITKFRFRDSVMYGKGPIKEHPVISVQNNSYLFIEISSFNHQFKLLCHFIFKIFFQDSQKILFTLKMIRIILNSKNRKIKAFYLNWRIAKTQADHNFRQKEINRGFYKHMNYCNNTK